MFTSISFTEQATAAKVAVADLSRFELSWEKTRWRRYVECLDECAAAFDRNPRSDWSADAENQRRYWEAANECGQLVLSRNIWDTVDGDLLRKKLMLIVEGSEAPPLGTEHDNPRNTLVELTTAAVFWKYGCTVSLLPDTDVGLQIGPITFAIECKRPATETKIEANVNDAKKQLRRVTTVGSRYGLIVVVCDRLLEYRSQEYLHAADTMVDLARGTNARLEKVGKQVQATTLRWAEDDHLRIPIAATLLGGVVLVRQQAAPIPALSLMAFPTGSPNSHAARECFAALEPMINRDPVR